MKKILIWAVATVLVFSMVFFGVGCKKATAEKEAAVTTAATENAAAKNKMRIVFVTHDLNPFFATVLVGIKDFAALSGWDATLIGPAVNDVQGTIETQYSVIASKPDAVAFTAIDSESFNAPIKKAQETGIFVVLFNTRAPGVKEATGVAYVGQEFIAAGNVAGYEICKYVKKHTGRTDGKIVMSNFAPGHFALEARNLGGSQGVERYNKEFGTTYTTEALATSSDEVEAIAKFEAKWSAESKEIVGWLSSEFTHGFIANWSKKAGLVGKFAVGGYDTLDSVLAGIKDGSVDFTLGQNPYGQGFITSALLYQGVIAKQPAGDVDTGAEMIDSTNIDKIIVREAVWLERGKALGIIK
jgi:ABC-type sugar transport system substrate-binding protein